MSTASNNCVYPGDQLIVHAWSSSVGTYCMHVLTEWSGSVGTFCMHVLTEWSSWARYSQITSTLKPIDHKSDTMIKFLDHFRNGFLCL